MRISEVSIVPIKIYRIRRIWYPLHFDGSRSPRKQYKYFQGTKEQCAKRIAWWYVFDRYNFAMDDTEMTRRTGLECDCDPQYPNTSGECPIHNRENGYLLRLAQRMTRSVLANFERIEAASGKEAA